MRIFSEKFDMLSGHVKEKDFVQKYFPWVVRVVFDLSRSIAFLYLLCSSKVTGSALYRVCEDFVGCLFLWLVFIN